MYLYFMPLSPHKSWSTALYFFFPFFILVVFCTIPQHSLLPLLLDDFTFLIIAFHRPLSFFFLKFSYPRPHLAILLPPPELSHCYSIRSRLCLPVHIRLFAARLHCVQSILGLELPEKVLRIRNQLFWPRAVRCSPYEPCWCQSWMLSPMS